MVVSNYNLAEWQALPPQERARAVAFLRLQHLEELHSQDAVQTKVEQLARQPQPRRQR